jgi:ssDNA thymidine ADP-ribosyltransferase, DarT
LGGRGRDSLGVSNGNAGAFYSQFFNRLSDLDKLDWNAIRSHDFRDPLTKEGKQAEFLLYGQFPWDLVEKIGVSNANTLDAAKDVVQNDVEVTVEPTWYY